MIYEFALGLYVVSVKWANDNQGVVTIVIFLTTVLFGWFSGIFSSFRRKPNFKISLLEGPTFCCTFPLGKQHKGYDTHRTAFALYLSVANIGSAPSSIEAILIGYHWNIVPFTRLWLKYGIGWFWLNNQVVALTEFQFKIGDNINNYPFLIQHSTLTQHSPKTYLRVEESAVGVVYFEQTESWGGCSPAAHNGFVKVKVKIFDAFGRSHSSTFMIPVVPLDVARKYNPSFGKTLAELHGETLPADNIPEPEQA